MNQCHRVVAITLLCTIATGRFAPAQQPAGYAVPASHNPLRPTTVIAATPHHVLEPPKVQRRVPAANEHHPDLPAPRAQLQTRATPIPNATRLPTWKAPFSYGHFGAAATRQWSHHRGHARSYTQWTLR